MRKKSGETVLYGYINGNYQVSCYGLNLQTRVYTALRVGEDLKPDFPDSIDLKITDCCNHGCSFCHESSNPRGKHFDYDKTMEKLTELIPFDVPVEIAIGGGNIFECWSDFVKLHGSLLIRGNCPRFTINVKDLRDVEKVIALHKELTAPCMGISISSPDDFKFLRSSTLGSNLDYINLLTHYGMPRMVLHVIVGLYPVEGLEELLDYSFKGYNILFLGYKQFGRALNSPVPDLTEWKDILKRKIFNYRSIGKYIFDRYSGNKSCCIGFDNLTIEQLDIQGALLDKEWDYFYLGNEFSHSMYIDAVKGELAPTSRSPKEERVSWDTCDIVSYFKNNHNKWS